MVELEIKKAALIELEMEIKGKSPLTVSENTEYVNRYIDLELEIAELEANNG